MPWEETENEIRHPVRDAADFQADSFRRITLKRDIPRVYGIIGKLKGKTSTTLQSLRFPKPAPDSWTLSKAKTWFKEHYKAAAAGIEHCAVEAELVRLPIQRLEAEFLASQGSDDRTAEVRWYSGATIQRFSWDKGEHELTFDMEGARLGRLNSGRAPLLNAHSNYKVSDVIGVVEKGWVENGHGRARVRFSQRLEVEPILADVRDGILRNISMGAVIHKLKETTTEGEKVRAFLATSWEPYELSIVPIGADPKAQFLSATEEHECELETSPGMQSGLSYGEIDVGMITAGTITVTYGDIQNAAPQMILALETPQPQPVHEVGPDSRAGAREESEMDKPIVSTGIESRPEAVVDLQAERASAAQAERDRISRITSLGTKWKKTPAFVAEHIERGTSAEDFGKLILDQAADADQRFPTQGASMSATNLQAFRNFGELLQAVASAAGERGRVDPRLRVELASGLNEAVGSEGGFLVQTDFSTQLLEAAMAASVVVPRCTRIPISNPANAVKLPAVNETSRADGSRWGGVQMYWKDEAAEKTASKPGFRLIELSLKKLIGLCYATDELLQDATALEAYVRAAFAAEAAFKLDDGVIRGLGAGVPLGILNAPCLVTVAKETGQAAATLKAENVVKMFSRMYAGGVANSVWLVNQDVFPQLYLLGQTVGTGGAPVYMPPGGLSGSPYSTLLGRPVLAIEQASTLGTVGDIIFADFTQYLVAEKGGMESASSVHVKFLYDETCFRFVYRFDGQPAWASALTPYQGTNTVSPFVVLATRA